MTTTRMLRKRARRLFNEDKYAEAYREFDAVIASTGTPIGFDFYFRAVAGLKKRRQPSERKSPLKQISDWTESIRLGYRLAASYAHRAEEYSRIGNSERALQDFHEAIRLDPDNGSFYMGRANMVYNTGTRSEQLVVDAIPDFTEAIRLLNEDDRRKQRCFFRRGKCYVATKEFENALADFGEALNLVGNDPYYERECLWERAHVFVKMSQFGKALVDLKAIAEATPPCSYGGFCWSPLESDENKVDVEASWTSLKLSLLRLKISDSTVVVCPKILMPRQLRNVDEWAASRPHLNIDQTVLFQMMTGQSLDFAKIPLIDYYSLFEDLGLPGFMYVVCKTVEGLTNLRHVLQMFSSASKHRRDSSLSEIRDDVSECPFVQSCLNVLKTHSEAIRQDPKLEADCNQVDARRRLLGAPAVSVRELPRFSQLADDVPTSFVALFQKRLRELSLVDPKQQTDVVLCTADGAEVPEHLGVLMCRTKFFLGMVKFDGKEKDDFLRTSKIHLGNLIHSELRELLHWIYRDEVDKSATLQLCLHLLQFAAVYHEREMTGAFLLAVLDRVERIPPANLFLVLLETAGSVSELSRSHQLFLKTAFAARLDFRADGRTLDGIGVIEDLLNFTADLQGKVSELSDKDE